MPRKKKIDDHGTGIPHHEVEALARILLPEIQRFYESEEGQREFSAWKRRQEGSPLVDAVSDDDSDDDAPAWDDPFWDGPRDDFPDY